MATRMKKLLDLDGSSLLQVSSAAFVNGTVSTGILMVSNNIIAFLNQVHTGVPGFLKLNLCGSSVCVFACVSAPEAINN